MVGRPTKYKPEYCEEIIAFLAEGYSVTAWAGSILVSRSSVYEWAKEHPEFSDALNVAKAAASLWWEDRLRKNALTGEGNATAAIFGLKNRSSDEWRETNRHEHTGPGGGPIQTIGATMTPQEAAEAYAAMLNPDEDSTP